jgi:hypothetical protein
MSLRESPRPSPRLHAAARRNARNSTGPRTPAGKQSSKMNALKHGERASPENHFEVMRALGEDPEVFENLKQELLASFGPGDAFWEKQIDDLARLYWRRNRLERAQEAVMRRALLAVEERQHHRRQEIAGATFDAAQAMDIDMPEPTDPGVRLRMMLSFLGVIRGQVKQRAFKPWQASEIEYLYQKKEGWRQARLLKLLRLFSDSVERSAPDQEPGEFLGKELEPGQQISEAQYQELLRLLDEEIVYVENEFQYSEKLNEQKAAIEREACLAPAGDEWRMMLRREETLDRSIDRKVKILLSLRKQYAGVGAALVPAQGGHKGCPDSRPVAAGPSPESSFGPQGEGLWPAGRSALRSTPGDHVPVMTRIDNSGEAPGARHPRQARPPRWRVSEKPETTWAPACAGTTTMDENSNINERSGNVIENKGRPLNNWKKRRQFVTIPVG